MKEIRRSAIVEHGAREMYALVDDIASYPRFLPWCTGARVEEAGGRKRATLEAGVRGLKQCFTTLNANKPGEAIDMQLVEGPFRHFESHWRFRALGENACEIEFRMRYEFASRALATLLGPLFNRIADTMVDAFTRRADELHGPHPR